MILHITDQRILREIQMEFSKHFPYLRVEFFTPSHHNNLPAEDSYKIDSYTRAGNIRKKHYSNTINLFPDTSVREFELMMQKDFQADVQVFHYTKAGWIQTDSTDTATLNELNEQGRRHFNEMFNTAAQTKNLF